jgi:hypothetical protein
MALVGFCVASLVDDIQGIGHDGIGGRMSFTLPEQLSLYFGCTCAGTVIGAIVGTAVAVGWLALDQATRNSRPKPPSQL